MILALNTPWPYLLTAAIVVVVGWYARRQPRRPGTRFFGWMIGNFLVGALAACLTTVAPSRELRYGLWALMYIAALLQSSLGLMVALEYTGHERWLRRSTLVALAIPAFVFALLALFLPMTDLVSFQLRLGEEALVSHPATRWAGFVVNFGIWLGSLAVLVQCLVRAPAFRVPAFLLILAEAIPRFAFVMADAEHLPVSPLQLSILTASVSALIYLAALHYFHWLQVSPVARDVAINHMRYGLLVLDSDNHLVDVNPAAQTLLGFAARPPLRQPAERVLGTWWERLAPVVGPEPAAQDVVVQNGAAKQVVQVNSWPLLQSSGWRVGQVLLVADVTQLRQAQQQQAQVLWAQASLQEREQLADELHDGLSQGLGFLNLQSQTARLYLLAGQQEAADEALTRLTDATFQIQKETRELIGDLLTISQPTQNIGASLRQILSYFQQQTGLDVRLELDEAANANGPAPEVAVQLARIAQEALTNVRKHASDARQVSVRLTASNHHLQLTIVDDGPGFVVDGPPVSGNHFGLQLMRQRAARIGGEVTVRSVPGHGTRVEVCVPLNGDTTEVHS